MTDRRRWTEFEGVQAIGRLSDEMVFSLGRAVRDSSGDISDSDLIVFGRAADLFETLLAGDATPATEPMGGTMFSAGGYVDALRVVQHRADPGQFEGYARKLAELLRGIVARHSVQAEEKPALRALREIFAEVGEATLSRADELTLPQEAHWPAVRQAI